jgi:ribosomal protein S18 acetylase RimI-like enzyme
MDGTLDSLLPSRAIWSGRVATGGYLVRSGEPEDADLIREFVRGLSVRTQYLRFFTAVASPSPSLLRALAGGGPSPSDILLITDEHGAVIGHGMAVDVNGDGVPCSDIGLVIADQWQGLGLGSMLVRLLANRALERGVVALVLEVLHGNTAMLGLIHKHSPQAMRQGTRDSIVITAVLAQRPFAAAGHTAVASPSHASSSHGSPSYRRGHRDLRRPAAA